ncbi:DNA-binding protein [Lederbergia wuyishanensis]|uniref:DNA-directed RNA polymerase alpha subunit n=1 Tax=Lederbergia wuyishanensis TaxID=1347903 RepID=A0ABU0D821_9BACI|nr:DNA-binding protein [Lederbergia wuyishanensis]MCJ8009332.1 DNA-binding protein [Lederbergia wuyishanensis]MDQ0344533.1 DNA-directed RNA polymerase alpha subunit [Lederbergia wuyishanensis]
MEQNKNVNDFDQLKGLSKPAKRALAGAGYEKLEQLTNVYEADLLKLHGMGPKAIAVILEALAEKGWTFR